VPQKQVAVALSLLSSPRAPSEGRRILVLIVELEWCWYRREAEVVASMRKMTWLLFRLYMVLLRTLC